MQRNRKKKHGHPAYMGIRILVADDHPVVRQGLVAMLDQNKDFEIVQTAADGCEAVDKVRETEPDVVVMDLSMPKMDGITATRKMMQNHPGIRVLCLSMHRNRTCVHAALAAGASGYLLKDCAGEELAEAVRRVAAGSRYLSPLLPQPEPEPTHQDEQS